MSQGQRKGWKMHQMRISLGTIWTAILCLIGVALLLQPVPSVVDDPVRVSQLLRCAGIWGIASGIFVFLVVVVDAMSRKKPIANIGLLKVFVGTIQWLALGYGVFLASQLLV
ncbi:MAG: hypothetical protein CMJ19_18960 [Phycisphaeraceae bacterium]|nr:hypothetical protein [Phycisphaeraceae bacterium]